MLVVKRKVGESIHIGRDVIIKVIDQEGSRLRVGIQAPKAINIRRCEISRGKFPSDTK